jgi:selenide, water dikinase
VLGDIPLSTDDRVLVDYRTADDAGVYRWAGGPALVQTVDFFTPVVDDPYMYGQIAAANALSDVYAMGGEPRTALAIAALPADDPGPEIIKTIFRGGYDKLREARVVLLGGHTVSDREIKFGYAVTGEIDPNRIFRNAGARIGDALILTKPLGTGIISTAIKFARASESQVAAAIASMSRLNRDAAEVARALVPGAVSACTDVTGFGLAGHASEMAAASQVTIVIESKKLPLFEDVLNLATANFPGGGKTNRSHFDTRVSWAASIGEPLRRVIYDPQTSGGLLLAIDQTHLQEARDLLEGRGIDGRVIGRVEPPATDGMLLKIE